ncbi:MAG: glycosyltransferase family 2 protein [Candidatus Magasanikbacteria bacterium]|nr:glycosyltransferase family 2 protein [Candidatus Magasanikbacteria bacterium]
MDDIAVTIVNYKMKEDTARCLDSLFADIAGSALRVRVVVLDNASGDNIAGYLAVHFPTVSCITLSKNIGFGAGQNVAMTAAPAKYYFLVNPDIVFSSSAEATEGKPEGHVLQRLFDWMEAHPKVGMAGPQLLNRDGSLQYSCYRFPRFFAQPARRLGLHARYRWAARDVDEFLMKDFDHTRTQPVDWIMGSAMFVRAASMTHVGMFDDRFFMYFEDCDWCRRFWEAGWPVYYVHDIKLVHGHRRASAAIPGMKAVLLNPLTRIHIRSWLKYFWKWRHQK